MIHLGVNSKPENCDNIDRENILKEKKYMNIVWKNKICLILNEYRILYPCCNFFKLLNELSS